jgi:hypothetical protein
MVRLIDFVARWTIRAAVVLFVLAVLFNVVPPSKVLEPVRTVLRAVVG